MGVVSTVHPAMTSSTSRIAARSHPFIERLQIERAHHIGRVCYGFDFLGYAFSTEGLGVAARSIGHLAAHVSRLYEQGADSCRIGDYVQRWWGWLEAGLVAERQQAPSANPGAVRPLPA
jgi:hypothetical protein